MRHRNTHLANYILYIPIYSSAVTLRQCTINYYTFLMLPFSLYSQQKNIIIIRFVFYVVVFFSLSILQMCNHHNIVIMTRRAKNVYKVVGADNSKYWRFIIHEKLLCIYTLINFSVKL